MQKSAVLRVIFSARTAALLGNYRKKVYIKLQYYHCKMINMTNVVNNLETYKQYHTSHMGDRRHNYFM